MKQKLMFIFIIVFALGVVGCTAEASSETAMNPNKEISTIQVSGNGSVSVKPDTAIINANILAEEKNLKEAKLKVNQTNNQILKELEVLGLTEEDIKSTISVNYIRNYQKENKVNVLNENSPSQYPIVGYKVQSNLTIETKKLDDLEKIIDILTAYNNVTVGNFRFSVEDKDTGTDMAIEKAVKDAKRKANKTADLLNVEILKAHKVIVNSQNHSPSPVYYRESMMTDAVSTSKTNIQTGSQDITVNVSIEFEIN